MNPWNYCHGCMAKGPIPGCPLCQKLNGRPMTKQEDDALAEGLRPDLPDGWWLDVPFEDGTTPRQRQA